MRLPNGYGSVIKLPGKRRKPYRVRITEGWSDDKTQIFRNLGYYRTKSEALAALAEYHKNPNTIEVAEITFAEVFEKWSKVKFEKAGSKSTRLSYNSAYNYCTDIYDMKFVEIKTNHLQAAVDNCPKGAATKKNIKVLFNQLYSYAIKNDITNKDYSEYVELGKTVQSDKREPFTSDEIAALFETVHRLDDIDTILIMIYTGLRISELLKIKIKDVDIENRTMRGGIKTEAGKNRIIPINKKILPYIIKRKAEGTEFLIPNNEQKEMSYWTYKDRWVKLMEQLQMEHLPHDCRHTFATLMDNAGANKLSIKRIMGNASKDITDKVYTHKDIDELKKAVDLI